MPGVRKIEIVTGFSCNNNCLFCSVGDKLRSFDKTTSQVIKDIDRASKESPQEISFTGGEPTLRRDFFRIVRYAREKGVPEVRVTTNGRLFSYEDFCSRSRDAGLTGAVISFHTHDKEIHDYLSCAAGSLRQTMMGFDNLCSGGMKIDVNTVVTSKTIQRLPFTMKVLGDCPGSVCIIFPTIDGHLMDNIYLVPRMSDAEENIKASIDVLNSKGIQPWVLNYPPCFMKGYERYSSMMEMKTKMFWPENDTNLDEKRSTDNSKVRACRRCRFRDVCTGVMKGYIEVFGDKEIKPVSGRLVKRAQDAY